MPSRKNRRQDPYPDWESSETDESCTNSHNHNIVDQANAGGPSEHEKSDGNGYTNNNGGAARSIQIQGKVSKSSQPKQKVTLGPWTSAIRETLQSFDETQRNINNLQKIFTLHAKTLERVDENSRTLHELQEMCEQKDKDVESLENTITTLTSMQIKTKAQLERESARIEEERIELNQEKEKQKRRFTMVAAEEKHKADQEFEKRTTQQEEIFKKRKQELEDEAALKRDETDRKATIFEAEREKLLAAIKKQELQIKTQAQKLEKIEEKYDSLERAKISIRKEKEDREAELIAVNKEFALDARPMSYFVESFEKIESEIGKISEKYFHSIEEKDFEKVREELGAADPIFKSVPIEDSDDSRDLCTAHAQRVISKAICEDIWKPFSSEFTALQPESSIFLGKISDEIDQSDHGGRTATFWNARTMRALKSLRADSVASRDSESSGYPYPTRTGSVISKVFVISSLFDSSQNESLRKDLVSLVNSAVEVWDNVQAGGSKITVSLLLDRAHREKYPPKQFDPTCEGDETNQDLTSTTHSRIFPLFPRVLAPAVENSEKHGNGLPGSWPTDSNLIVIHPGKGLPDWSPLVVRGKEAEEERKDLFRTVLENLKKQFQSTKRGPGNGRRGSRGSVSSGTPSEQWKSRGAIEFIEN